MPFLEKYKNRGIKLKRTCSVPVGLHLWSPTGTENVRFNLTPCFSYFSRRGTRYLICLKRPLDYILGVLLELNIYASTRYLDCCTFRGGEGVPTFPEVTIGLYLRSPTGTENVRFNLIPIFLDFSGRRERCLICLK